MLTLSKDLSVSIKKPTWFQSVNLFMCCMNLLICSYWINNLILSWLCDHLNVCLNLPVLYWQILQLFIFIQKPVLEFFFLCECLCLMLALGKRCLIFWHFNMILWSINVLDHIHGLLDCRLNISALDNCLWEWFDGLFFLFLWERALVFSITPFPPAVPLLTTLPPPSPFPLRRGRPSPHTNPPWHVKPLEDWAHPFPQRPDKTAQLRQVTETGTVLDLVVGRLIWRPSFTFATYVVMCVYAHASACWLGPAHICFLVQSLGTLKGPG